MGLFALSFDRLAAVYSIKACSHISRFQFTIYQTVSVKQSECAGKTCCEVVVFFKKIFLYDQTCAVRYMGLILTAEYVTCPRPEKLATLKLLLQIYRRSYNAVTAQTSLIGQVKLKRHILFLIPHLLICCRLDYDSTNENSLASDPAAVIKAVNEELRGSPSSRCLVATGNSLHGRASLQIDPDLGRQSFMSGMPLVGEQCA